MKKIELQRSMWVIPALILGLVFLISAPASAAVTSVTPNTWNIIGLDSNTPASGPYRFPVGAKVCGGSPGADESATLTWDSGGTDNGTYIYLRAGSANPATITYGADGCADAYFEVEVDRSDPSCSGTGCVSFDQTRRYHITAGSVPTPTPRELYVERLVSQSRNYITNVKLNGVSIPTGGSMNLMVGNTYDIELVSKTATQGYEQLETFINFPNTIFQVLSVKTTYSADTTSNVPMPGPDHEYLYADGCGWENDPNSPNSRACNGDGKAGGDITTTYTVKILSGAGTSQTLSSLIYDFSGSSFHYNADYSTGARYANIVGPSSITINKTFTPNAILPNSISTMKFRLTNPTSESFTGVNFSDSTNWPSGLAVATLPNVTYSGCGAGAFSPSLVGGATSASFSGATLSPNSVCTITVDVSAPAGTYTNTTNNLYINSTVDTGNTGSDTLTASFAPACIANQTAARWTVPSTATNPPDAAGGVPTTIGSGVSSATASFITVGSSSIIATDGYNDTYSWRTWGWKTLDESYVLFKVDTSNYSGSSISLWAKRDGTVGPTPVKIDYSTNNGSSYSAATDFNLTAAYQQFAINIPSNNTVWVRFRASGANNNNQGADMFIDDVLFQGCRAAAPAPTISKSFLDPILLTSVTAIKKGNTSTLRFTINNTTSGNQPLTGITFSDVLPAGLSIADSSGTQCGGTVTTTASTRAIALTGGSLAAGGSCTINVTVTGTTEGQYQNVSGNISATESSTNTGGENVGYAVASLTVIAPPTIAKSFSPTSIYTGNTSALTFTITNPNTANSLSNVGFTDSPLSATGGLEVASPNGLSGSCGGGTITAVAGTTSVSLSGATLSANSSCTFSVNVKGTVAEPTAKDNTTGVVTSTEGGNGNTATASIIVSDQTPSIDLTKQVSTSSTGPWTKYVAVAEGSSVYYRFKVYNSGDTALYNIGIIETVGSISPSCSWPSPLAVGDTDYCVSGAVTAVAGSNVNTAYATAKYPSGGTTYNSANSSATYATTGLTIAKSATKLNGVSFTEQPYFTVAGDVLTYSYTVTNTGAAVLLGPATVADNKSTDESCPALATIGDNDNYFDLSELVTCTATYTIIASDVPAGQVINTATATVGGATSPAANKTVSLAMPSLTVIKSVTAYSDPINGTTGPKAIPGSFMTYTILVTNTGLGQADNNSTVIADPIPANTELFVGDIDGAGSAAGPVLFTDGATCSAVTALSGLSYNFISLGDLTDNISFSDDPGPYTYDYTPTGTGCLINEAPYDNGCDAGVTSLKVTLGGPFNGTVASGGSNTSFCLQFRVRVK